MACGLPTNGRGQDLGPLTGDLGATPSTLHAFGRAGAHQILVKTRQFVSEFPFGKEKGRLADRKMVAVSRGMGQDPSGEAVDGVPKRQWALHILGGFRLTDQGGTEATGLGKLDRALLAYLVLSGQRRHSRAKLAELLWPSRSAASQSLRESLYALRRVLGDKDGSIFAMKSDPLVCHFENIDVDALALGRHVLLGTPEALERAEALYVGDLLEGLDIRSDEFDRWLISERARLQGVAVDGLSRLMRYREQTGQSQKAIETAQRILQLDELTEDAHRTIIAVHLRTGQRAAARKHAQYCEELLKQENIEPEADTRRLIAACRRADNHLEDRPESLPQPATEPPAPQADLTAETVPGTSRLAEEIWHTGEVPAGTSAGGQLHASETPSPGLPTAPRSKTHATTAETRVLRDIRLILMLIAASLIAAAAAMIVIFWNQPASAPVPFDRLLLALRGETPAEAIPAERPWIAVLPFEGHGDSNASDYADSISGDVGDTLLSVSEIGSVPRTSVLALSDKRLSPAEIAKSLRVRYLLEGRLNKEGSHFQVSVTLIDTLKNDEPVSIGPFDASGSDVITLEKQIVRNVITQLEIALTEGEQERIDSKHGTQNVEAWLAASRGENLLRQLNPIAVGRARTEYETATRLDDHYAGAWEGRAWTYYIERRFGWSADPESSLRQADEFAQKSLDLDRTRGRTYSLLGSIRLLQGKFDEAVRLGKEAIDREPNDADSAALLAHTYTYVGQPRDAIDSIRRAIDLRRVPPRWYSWVLGRALRLSGDYKQAAAVLKDAIGVSPDSYLPLVELVATSEEMGDRAQAKSSANKIIMLNFLLNIKFSSSGWVNLVPYKDSATAARDIDALRSAGLPD